MGEPLLSLLVTLYLRTLQASTTMVLPFCWGHEVSLPQFYFWQSSTRLQSILFVVWDVADDKFFHKTNDSDATQFAILYPRISAHGTFLVSRG